MREEERKKERRDKKGGKLSLMSPLSGVRPKRDAPTLPPLRVITYRGYHEGSLLDTVGGCSSGVLWRPPLAECRRLSKDSDPRWPDSREVLHCPCVSYISCTWLTTFWG